MDRNALLKRLDGYIEVEDEAIKLYKEAMDMIDHFAFRLIFEELMMDSTKHKRIFEAIKEAVTKTTNSEWDLLVGQKIGRYVVPFELERHIKLEENMIDGLKKEIKTVEKGIVQQLLKRVLEDEQRHHSTLKNLIEKLLETS